MTLVTKFKQINQSGQVWQPGDRVLLAVSGGVDSMVLLDLWQQLPPGQQPDFAVAHVNHQLRDESAVEETFLRAYCDERQIPFFCYRWEEGPTITSHVESRAREIRYAFFRDIVARENFSGVVTAHHSDDQGETFLMKVIRGSQLKNLVSMEQVSHQRELTIFRPFLLFTKEEILTYAKEHAVPYMEDESNLSAVYLRNRLRHDIMPQLKAENDNFLQHIHSLVKQIEYANSIIAEVTLPLYQKIINQIAPQRWQLDLSLFQAESAAKQYMLLVSFFQETLIQNGTVLQEKHLVAVQDLLNSQTSFGEIDLPDGWQMLKNYEQAWLQVKSAAPLASRSDECFTLVPGHGMFVSENEYFYLIAAEDTPALPPEVQSWSQKELCLSSDLSDFPLVVRRPETKERFVMNRQGNTKEIRRLLIDEKIPRNQREKVWVVRNQQDLLWIVPIRKSYLSISKETDKIHYRLIYLKR